MKGFKIKYDNQEYTVGQVSKESTLLLILSIANNEDFFKIDLRGYDHTDDMNLEWIQENAKTNSKIEIEFLNKIDQISPPKNKRFADSNNFANTEKLKYFFRLKKELEDKGLI
jgi:hypothetical protein